MPCAKVKHFRDRRVANTETDSEPNPAISNPFNRLFVSVTPQFHEVNDGTGHPTLKVPNFSLRQVVEQVLPYHPVRVGQTPAHGAQQEQYRAPILP